MSEPRTYMLKTGLDPPPHIEVGAGRRVPQRDGGLP
jgi:hypothetical protein